MTSPSIQCKGLAKSYGVAENKVAALKETNLDVFPSKLTLLMGPSGSGKTTLISIIATILTPDSGQLFLLDQEIGLMNEDTKSAFRGRNIGIVFQSLFLIPALTVLENIALPLIVRGTEERKALNTAKHALERVHLSHKASTSPSNLSKGQQQKIAIARAMITEANIIICDEPTSALDHTAGFEIMEFLHGLARNDSKTVLVVTHDPRIIPYADTVITMSDGEIVQEKETNK